MTVDTYAAAIFSNCLVAVIFGVFKVNLKLICNATPNLSLAMMQLM